MTLSKGKDPPMTEPLKSFLCRCLRHCSPAAGTIAIVPSNAMPVPRNDAPCCTSAHGIFYVDQDGYFGCLGLHNVEESWDIAHAFFARYASFTRPPQPVRPKDPQHPFLMCTRHFRMKYITD